MTTPSLDPADLSAIGVAARQKLRAKKYVITPKCTKFCSLNEVNLVPDIHQLYHSWYEEGKSREWMVAESKKLGKPISNGAFGRHFKHLIPFDDLDQYGQEVTGIEPPALSDLQIIERLIQVGARGLATNNVKVGPEMLMKAMELKYKLTQGNVFQGFLDAVNAAMAPESEESASETTETPEEVPA